MSLAYSPVLRLSRLLHPASATHRMMAVIELNGYFDESGTHAQAPVIVVAGYLSPARDWRRFEIKWRKVLKEEDADYLHTADLEADPPRGIYEGWTRRKADHLSDRLVPLAVRYAGRPYGVHFLASAWYAAVPFVKEFLPDRSHDAPYKILAKACIEAVIRTQEASFAEQIAFGFENNDWSNALLAGYQIIKREHPRSSILGPLAIYDKYDPKNPEHSNVMLQAADLLAWHYRKFTEIRKGFVQATFHRAATQLFRRDRV